MLKADLASEESELSHYLQTHSKGSYVMSLLEWPETQHRETVNGQQSSQRTFHMGRTENNQIIYTILFPKIEIIFHLEDFPQMMKSKPLFQDRRIHYLTLIWHS